MTTITGWITTRRSLAEKATPYPWCTYEAHGSHGVEGPDEEMIFVETYGITHTAAPADAQFVADARTSLPTALTALETVANLHRRVGTYEVCTASNIHDCDDNMSDHVPVIAGGDYIHPDVRIGWACDECRDDEGQLHEWPCPTIATITRALGIKNA